MEFGGESEEHERRTDVDVNTSLEVAALVAGVEGGNDDLSVEASILTEGAANDLEGLGELLDGVLILAGGGLTDLRRG